MSDVAMSKPLGQFITLAKGKPPAESDYTGENACIYLTPEYLRGRATPELVRPAPNAVFVKQGETIVLWDGSNAGEVFYAKKGALSSTMARIDHSDSFNDDYFYYSLKGWEAYLKGQTSGSGIPHVDREILEGLTIFDCDVPEQAKIAEVLSTVDRAIEQTEALIAKQQRIKTGLMADLLTRGIDADGNLRSEATHEFKDSPLGRIPVEWEVVQVGEVIAGIDGGWSPSCEDVTPALGEWGILKVSAISSGVFNPKESKRLPLKLKPIEKIEVREQDVLISRANGVAELVGRCVYVSETPSKLMLSDKTLRLNPRTNRITPFLLSILMSVESSKRQILNYISGSSGQKNLSQKQIASIQLILPPLKEQEEICSMIAKETKQFESGLITQRKLRSLKTALMQDLLTGKVRVSPLLT